MSRRIDLTAGRTKTDMHWIKAESGAVNVHALYLVKMEAEGRRIRDKEIMAGSTVLACLRSKIQGYPITWMAKITNPIEVQVAETKANAGAIKA
jgi:hypothetical protein